MNTIIIVGGCSKPKEQGALTSIEMIRLEEDDQKIELHNECYSEMVIPRRSPSAFYSHNTNDLLIVGGCESEGKHLNSVEVFTNGKFQELKEFPDIGEHSCAAYCSLNDKEGIIIGGYNGTDCLKEAILVRKDERTIQKIPPFISKTKNAVALPANEDDTVFLFGGWDEDATVRAIFRVNTSSRNNDLDNSPQYLPYEFEGILPGPIEGHAAVRHGNIIFSVGGFDGIIVVDTIIRWDIITKEKQILPIKLKTARENHICSVLLNKYLVVAGGWDGRNALSSVEIFLISESQPYLTKVAGTFSLLSPRNRPGAVACLL